MKKNLEKKELKESLITKKEIKIACQLIMVVFSMCFVIALMFFATYKREENEKSHEAKENVEAFKESNFYQIISSEI